MEVISTKCAVCVSESFIAAEGAFPLLLLYFRIVSRLIVCRQRAWSRYSVPPIAARLSPARFWKTFPAFPAGQGKGGGPGAKAAAKATRNF